VSGEQLTLILKHADRRKFVNHYHPREVETDTRQILCGLNPDLAFMRAIRRHDRWGDKRRPHYLSAEEKKHIEGDPKLEEALQGLRDVEAEYEQNPHPDLFAQKKRRERNVRNIQKRLLRALRNQIREEWDEEQAFLFIEAQLSGEVMVDESDDELSSDMYMPPPQLNPTQKLTACPTSGSLEVEWRRHDEATEAVTMYCGILEGWPLRGRPKKTPPKPVVARNDNSWRIQQR
jgi:hypothetical protein